MSLEIVYSDYFRAEAKRLAKRYRGFVDDLEAFTESLRENPYQGVEIAPKVRKIRMAVNAKGRGKSGGVRIITFNALISESEGKIVLLLLYDKADASNIKMNVLAEIIKELGL